jgi:hypothetical protein
MAVIRRDSHAEPRQTYQIWRDMGFDICKAEFEEFWLAEQATKHRMTLACLNALSKGTAGEIWHFAFNNDDTAVHAPRGSKNRCHWSPLKQHLNNQNWWEWEDDQNIEFLEAAQYVWDRSRACAANYRLEAVLMPDGESNPPDGTEKDLTANQSQVP